MEENEEIQAINTDNTTETTSYTPYEPINFENGTLVSPGKINLETCEITMPVYSGKAPINDTNLNHMEQGIVELENHSIFCEIVGEIDDTTGEVLIYNNDLGGN